LFFVFFLFFVNPPTIAKVIKDTLQARFLIEPVEILSKRTAVQQKTWKLYLIVMNSYSLAWFGFVLEKTMTDKILK